MISDKAFNEIDSLVNSCGEGASWWSSDPTRQLVNVATLREVFDELCLLRDARIAIAEALEDNRTSFADQRVEGQFEAYEQSLQWLNEGVESPELI